MKRFVLIPTGTDGGTRTQLVATRALAVVLLLLGLFTLQTFIDALAWAGIFAIAFWPLYCETLDRFGAGRYNLLWPFLFTLGVALIFIVPLGVVAMQFASESHAIGEWLRNAQRFGIAEPDLLRHLPFGQSQVDGWWQENLADPGSARDLLEHATRGRVAGFGRLIFGQLVRRVVVFLFTLLTLFFLFKGGHDLTRQLRRAVARVFGPGGERVALQIIVSVHGTVDGLVLVGLAEGVLLGVVYAIAGVPNPTMFGAVTAVAAMIPFAAPIVFGLAALILLARGTVIWTIAVFCIGMAVTFTADHFIRPALIGGSTKLPFLWVLLGILGGVEAWGLIGLFLGPAIMAALHLLWRELISENADRGPAPDNVAPDQPS